MGVSFHCYRVVTGVVIGGNFSEFLRILEKRKTAKTLDFKRFFDGFRGGDKRDRTADLLNAIGFLGFVY